MTNSITVKITCENGHTYKTRINGNLEKAKKYFLGKPITLDGNYNYDLEDYEEVITTVINVELV